MLKCSCVVGPRFLFAKGPVPVSLFLLCTNGYLTRLGQSGALGGRGCLSSWSVVPHRRCSQSAPCWMLPSWIHPLGAFGGEHGAMAPTWRPPPLVSQLATALRSCSKWDPPSSQSKGLLPPEGLTCPLSSVFTPQREGGQSLILLCLHGLAGGRHKARGSLPMVSSLGDAAPNARDRG